MNSTKLVHREKDMKISVVIPVYNEEDSLPLLYTALQDALGDVPDMEWEAVLVNDGSSDGSLEVLKKLAQDHPQHLCVVSLRRNFGQTAAIAAGIDYASGEVIVLMDADLQNDPADIPAMLQKIEEGYDVVSGWRIRRKDTFLTRTLPSRIANGLISVVTGVHLHDYGCTLKAYRREVITGFRLYGEMHRFIPAYASSVGARIVEMPVNHHPRKYGKTKYGLNRTIKVILDLFTVKFLLSYASKPIYVFGGTGMAMMAAAFLMLVLLVIRRQLTGIGLTQTPYFLVSITLGIMGFQAILMGLIAELLARTYHESQHKTTYVIRELIPSGMLAATESALEGRTV
jgi:glycosyltransferase involved in cell wall biosynthesis